MLTEDEIAALGQGLPDLSEWGPNILVPFRGKRLKHASVTWINSRWFLARGFDVSDQEQHRRVSSWLLSEFAYAVPNVSGEEELFTEEEKLLHADRYGSIGLAPHGGSGRVSVSGRFQTKGVGPTPLIGRGIDWIHSHGCLWMEEALREVILSEIFAAEFPFGANCALAILDAGFNGTQLDGSCGQRRALLVREGALRPAHFMRATMYRPTSGVQRGQPEDAHRVAYAIQHMESDIRAGRFPPIEDTFTHAAEQAAFGQIHRLFTGGYFPSNFLIGGGIIDFGAARSLPNWNQAMISKPLPTFGQELVTLENAVDAFFYYWNKNVKQISSRVSSKSVVESIRKAMMNRQSLELKRMWNFSDNDDQVITNNIVHAMKKYYHRQQKLRVDYTRYAVYVPEWPVQRAGPDSFKGKACDLLDEISRLIENDGSRCSNDTEVSRSRFATAKRFLAPRDLGREQIQGWLFDNVVFHHKSAAPDPNLVTTVIDSVISDGRRQWARLPANFIVLGQVYKAGTWALFGFIGNRSSQFVWICAHRRTDDVFLFDAWYKICDLTFDSASTIENQWTALFSISTQVPELGFDVLGGKSTFQVPQMSCWYDDPSVSRSE